MHFCPLSARARLKKQQQPHNSCLIHAITYDVTLRHDIFQVDQQIPRQQNFQALRRLCYPGQRFDGLRNKVVDENRSRPMHTLGCGDAELTKGTIVAKSGYRALSVQFSGLR